MSKNNRFNNFTQEEKEVLSSCILMAERESFYKLPTKTAVDAAISLYKEITGKELEIL